MSKHLIHLKVNGKAHELWVESNELLLNVLRDRLYLTGSKYGCGVGDCGACSVLHGDESVLSCLVLAAAADGWEITTVEGLTDGDKLNPVQQAFLDNSAVQCGFCVPGMVITSTALLRENSDPSEADVKDYLRGNYCRCTGYVAMIKSVLDAAAKMRGE
jgi:aerobic-type carbon monoxide dehydrogenase small subunit (CoxS/CutS family)